MPGRGAWSVKGRGGTLAYGPDGTTRPGPYYMKASTGKRLVGAGGWESPNANRRAVHGAVLAYQAALNAALPKLGLKIDGKFGQRTGEAVTAWQQRQPKEADISVWGGIGPSTSQGLLMPTLRATVHPDLVQVVCGLITQESSWDAGAVGWVDMHDVGLAQINARAHPDMSEKQRLDPGVCFKFVEGYLNTALDALGRNLRDAIASYNLGIGGARSWINAGRPDIWTPSGASSSRNVKAYINTILSACSPT